MMNFVHSCITTLVDIKIERRNKHGKEIESVYEWNSLELRKERLQLLLDADIFLIVHTFNTTTSLGRFQLAENAVAVEMVGHKMTYEELVNRAAKAIRNDESIPGMTEPEVPVDPPVDPPIDPEPPTEGGDPDDGAGDVDVDNEGNASGDVGDEW